MAFELDAVQLQAVETACANQLSLITGGAGTGKTTLIQEIAIRLQAAGESPALCAPTGKAAARLKEATGFNAGTIHRLLKSNGVIYMAGDLGRESVVVDESSMVSADLMAELMKRNPKRLILVGDAAQLTPVGKGQPFHDLLKLCPESVVKLTTCYRNSEAVFKAATAIRNGEIPLNNDESANERWVIVRTGTPEATHRAIIDYVRAGAIDFDQDIILVPRNGDNEDQPCTVKGLNSAIVDEVNPRSNDDDAFLPGDRVINTKNFADHDVWNGTTGKVISIDHEGCVWVKLDTPIVDFENSTDEEVAYKDNVLFDKDMKKKLQLAYALTVHKAQGSQYRNVLVVCLARDAFSLLDRSLIYTAVTRTQKQCAVLGQYDALCEGIRTVRTKRTVIQELAGGGE